MRSAAPRAWRYMRKWRFKAMETYKNVEVQGHGDV
jgi:hypothetical protein